MLNFQVQRDQVLDFFDEAQCLNIFSRTTEGQINLSKLRPKQLRPQQSIRAIQGIIEAIVYLELNFYFPSQIRTEHVICDKKVWGLRHAICYRSLQEEQEGEDYYNCEEFNYHENAENELVWNLGKIWLRFFTDTPIRIVRMSQEKINQIIDQNVTESQIRSLIKKLLCKDKQVRLSFQEFVGEKILINQAQSDSKIYSSVIQHLNKLSSFYTSSQFSAIRRASDIKNPFLKEQAYRQFREYLDIDNFLDKVKSQIKNEFCVAGQEGPVECGSYIIMLKSYQTLARLDSERCEMSIRFNDKDDRKYYAQFVRRMMTLKDILTRRSVVISKMKGVKPSFQIFLNNFEAVSPEMVYQQFKTCLKEYLTVLQKDIHDNPNDLFSIKLQTKIFLARSSEFVFREARTEVFKDFLDNKKVVDIKNILSRINECNDIKLLANLIARIRQVHY